MTGGLFLRTTVEALESVSSPSVAHAILTASLAEAALKTVPEEIGPFRRFVEGPLQSAVQNQLGAASVSHVLERLGHVLWMATSDVHALDVARDWVGLNKPRATADDESETESGEYHIITGAPVAPGHTGAATSINKQPTLPAPPGASSAPPRILSPRPARIPSVHVPRPPQPPIAIGRVTAPRMMRVSGRPLPTCVLVLSLDPALTKQTTAEIAGRCPVVRVATPAELARAASSSGDRLVLIIDTALPSIDLKTFVGLVPILPESSRVVLWGADERQRSRLATTFPVSAGWTASGDSTTPGELALAQMPPASQRSEG